MATITAACGSSATASKKTVTAAGGSGPVAPTSWTVDASNPSHNADFPSSTLGSVRWSFKEPLATPLHQLPLGTSVVGQLRASVRITQTVGNALGVSVVGSTLYAETDSGSLFALNARTGKLLWTYRTTNSLMGNPIVVGGRVFVGTGNSNWSFRELVNYKAGLPIQRGTGQNAILALSASTGKMLWSYPTRFEDMPTPTYLNGNLYEATGGGRMLALNAASGKLVFSTQVGGFDSMSSPIAWTTPSGTPLVYASFSGPDQVVAVNARTGAIAWRGRIPGSFNTSVSDEVLALDPSTGQLIANALTSPSSSSPTATPTVDARVVSFDAATGATNWNTSLGRGPLPNAFKAGVPMIHAGVIYMNDPAGDVMHAISEKTGKVLWKIKTHFPGRAAPAFDRGTLYFADGPFVYAVNPASGTILKRTKLGGLFGIVNPVIVGKTLFMDSSYSWVLARPLSAVAPAASGAAKG